MLSTYYAVVKKSKTLIQIILVIVIICAMLLLMLMNKNKTSNQNIVVLETSKGNIEITLDPGHSPVTVANFLTYVNEGYYDGLVFHRVIKGFMIQGGGFTKMGRDKPSHPAIILESNNGLQNKAGTIAMARTNVPDSATSQFFINTADNANLDYVPSTNPGYAVFGFVSAGMDVVRAIESVKVSSRGPYDNWPVEDITIIKAYVKK